MRGALGWERRDLIHLSSFAHRPPARQPWRDMGGKIRCAIGAFDQQFTAFRCLQSDYTFRGLRLWGSSCCAPRHGERGRSLTYMWCVLTTGRRLLTLPKYTACS